MSEEQNNQSPPVIAEVLIATGIELAKKQDVKLVELVGHFQIATMEVFNRNVAAAAQAQAQAQNQAAEPSEGGDTEEPVAFSPDASEDKDES